MSTRLSVALLFLAVLAPGAAFATEDFPGAIRAHLSLDYTPPCSLCHVNNNPGATAWTPFATSIRSQGAQAENESSLFKAIERAELLQTDSDGDGASDVSELRDDTDPNSPIDVSLSGATLGHGCNADHPASHERGGAAGGVALALLLGALKRRLARCRPTLRS